MNITRAAIEKNRITIMALVAICMGGVLVFQNLPRDRDPGFVVRWATVTTDFPGASPERVEQLITDPLEKAIQEIPELDYIASVSKTGYSSISLMIKESYSDMRPIWDDLRRKMEQASARLPEGAIGPRVNDELDDVFGIQIALMGEGYTYAELKDVADDVRDELLHLPDAAKVDIFGAQAERIFVEYDDSRLAELGVSPMYLMEVLRSRNIIIPGGEVRTGRERLVLEPTGNFLSVQDLRRTVVSLPGGQVVYLEDLVDVSRGYVDPPGMMVRYNGEPCLGLAVSMRQGGNITVLGAAATKLIRQLEQNYPIGIEFREIYMLPDDVNRKVDDFVNSLYQSVGIVLVVMLLTLGLRTGLLVATLIPMAMLMSIMIMPVIGERLHQVSLAALIIALGMLVDNAIVMSESIVVQIGAGRRPIDAAVDSARELRVPLLVASLTTSAAFLPIYLAESMVGEYTRSLFTVTTVTLLCSWILSLTMIPMFCARFLKVKAKSEERSFDTGFYRRYRACLLAMLRHRWLSMGAVGVVFVVAMAGFGLVPGIFFPPTDESLFVVDYELPLGTPIESTDALIEEVDTFVADELLVAAGRESGVTSWASFAGGGPLSWSLGGIARGGSPEYGFSLFHTTSHQVLEELMDKLERFCNVRFPDLQTSVRRLGSGPPVDIPVAVRVSGRDVDVLFELVGQLKDKLRSIPGTKNVEDNWGPRTKKLLVKVAETRARRAGITNQDVAISLQAVLDGFQPTEYREADKVIPVTVRSVAADREDLGKLEGLSIYSSTTGQSVPLKQVADIEVVWEPSMILRYNRYKTVTVQCRKEEQITAAEITAVFTPWLEEESATWPSGYTFEMGGEAEESAEANQSLADKIPIAFLIILLLLVGQFNSFRRPLIILSTIPLGLIGVVVGLLVGRSYFGFMTFLGVISLAGIVINNAIVLLDRIRIESEENGLDLQRAVVEAAQRRMRPILLTTATTIGGLTPLLINGGGMWETMALAIMFGLLFSTVMTLGVVPVLYSLLFRVNYRGFTY
jgi:multidrug efflux pump